MGKENMALAKLMPDSNLRPQYRWTWIALSVIGLGVVYLLQSVDWLDLLCPGCSFHPNTRFAVKRIVRVLLNDSFMLLFIHVWFADRSITRLALIVQAIDTLILLPLYLVVKLSIEGDEEISMPFLSQLHRLIVNPTLMVLLIPAVYYQRAQSKQSK